MHLPQEITNFLRFLFDLGVMTIGVKMILAHWIVERVTDWWGATFSRSEIHQAILAHYTGHALHDGHEAASIVDCQQGMCAQIV